MLKYTKEIKIHKTDQNTQNTKIHKTDQNTENRLKYRKQTKIHKSVAWKVLELSTEQEKTRK